MAERLSERDISSVAEQLARATDDRVAVDELLHEPVALSDGYRIQDAVHRLQGDELIAWKVGVTNVATQELLQIDEPLFGRSPRAHVVNSPAELRCEEFASHPHVEVEVGFRVVDDVRSVPVDALELADGVEPFAAIEVVAARLAGFPLIPAAQLAADNVVSARIIVGSPLDLTPAEVRRLDAVAVELTIGDERVAAGFGDAALGHPLGVLQRVARHALARGEPLREGQLVITGTCTGLEPVRRGCEHVGRVGDAAVHLRVE